MPPVGDDPVARRRRAAAAAAAFATSARAPSSPRWRRRPAAAAPPRRPEPVAPLTDAAIAAAPNRISLKKWNRRRPCGGPSRSRCRPRARESSDKEEERAALCDFVRDPAGHLRPRSKIAPHDSYKPLGSGRARRAGALAHRSLLRRCNALRAMVSEASARAERHFATGTIHPLKPSVQAVN